MKDSTYIAIGTAMLIAFLFLAVGWFMNISAILNGSEDQLIRVIRIIGIFLSPVGGVMGWM